MIVLTPFAVLNAFPTYGKGARVRYLVLIVCLFLDCIFILFILLTFFRCADLIRYGFHR